MKKTVTTARKITALLLTAALAALTGCGGSAAEKKTGTVIADYEPFSGSSSAEISSEGNRTVTETETSVSVIAGTAGKAAETTVKHKLLEGDFCLIKNGEVKCTIVMDAGCNQKVYAAAWDLADSLESMTGKAFPVVEVDETTPEITGNKILLGNNSYTREIGVGIPSGYPDNEGFVIISSLNIMVLAGNDESYYNGTAFAVTSFLESLGFGWFANDPLWNVVPHADTVYAPSCNILSKPSFPTRFNRVALGDESSNPVIAKRWFLGGEPSEVNHKFTTFFPTGKYGTVNDIYALVNGKRSIEGLTWWQCCLSNETVQQEVIRQVKEFFRENPEYTGVSIGQNDGNGGIGDVDYGNFCECDRCKAFGNGFTVQIVKFANIVARAVKEEYPDKTLMIYAYESAFNAPTEAMLGEKIESNVLIMMCRQGGMTRVIRNGDSFDESMNLTVGKRAGALFSDGTIAKTAIVKDNFLNWKKLGAQVGIYEWNCPGAAGDNEWRYRFWLQGKAFVDNARWLRENGCRFIYIDQGPNGSYESNEFDCYELRWPLWYVSAKAMWDCSLSFEDIMMSACKRLYGNAADIMFEFYDTLADASVNCDVFCYEWTLPSGAEMYGGVASKLDSIMAKARKQGEAAGGEIAERIENQYEYWKMTKAHSGL